MRLATTLPPPPHFDIEVLEELPSSERGFLRRLSRRLTVMKKEGGKSAAFVYDQIERDCLDAVVVVPHFIGPDAARYVVLRSAVRPPIVLRSEQRSPVAESSNRALWEVPAGLVDEGEYSPEGIRLAAVREMHEEVGLRASPDELSPLGPSSFPAPGMVAERHFYFHIEVDLAGYTEPLLDGSPLEEAGEVLAVPLALALREAREGGIEDAKTELALRRLDEILREEGSQS